MKKNKLLLLAGILGFALMGTSCFKMPSSGGGMGRAEGMHVETITRQEDEIVIAEPCFQEEAPTSEKKTAAPARQWEDKDTGFVIFGVLMGLSACLIATMITLSVMKKKKAEQPKEEEK